MISVTQYIWSPWWTRLLQFCSMRGRNRNLKLFFLLCFSYVCFLILSTWTSSPTNSSNVQSSGVFHKFFSRSCVPKKNLVYIKMFKSGSTTLNNMFRRFGHERNLSFVLPRQNRLYLGFPYRIRPDFYRPSKLGYFNILCDHAVYDKDSMTSFMPEDTVYITSIREPYSQFKSTFHYFKIGEIAQVPGEDTISEYLNNIYMYEERYMSHNYSKYRYCIPDGFSLTRNLMAFTLGFQTGFPKGSPNFTSAGDQIMNFITSLRTEFHLVMLVEYFDESLILLKRLMCWNFKDIVYISENVGNYNYKNDTNPHNAKILESWSNVDHILYNTFKEELLNKIADQSRDFKYELKEFQRINKEVKTFCTNMKSSSSLLDSNATLSFSESSWSEAFTVDETFCELLTREDLMEVLKARYDAIPIIWADEKPSVYFC